MSHSRKAPSFELISITGPVGQLECLRLAASTDCPRGIVLVAHPNPLEGGTFSNKIVHTLAKTLSRLGYIAYCPNLRGVGNSEGVHDYGKGEVDDMQAVLQHAQLENPDAKKLLLAGFSFGTHVQTQLHHRLADTIKHNLILIGPATSRYVFQAIPTSSIVIHGENDEVIPMQSVLDWARPQQLPVIILPGAGHFFHGRLTQLTQIIESHASIF